MHPGPTLAALLAAAVGMGPPPDLPPLPGPGQTAPPKQAPTKPAQPRPRQVQPSAPPAAAPEGPSRAPTAGTEAPPPAPPLPVEEPADPQDPATAPTLPEPPGDVPEFSNPVYVEPPQPEVEPSDPVEGPGAAPLMDDLGPDEIPGGPDRWPRLPPPERPPYSGVGMFIGGGVTFVVALIEQIIAHRLVAEECIRPAEGTEIVTTEDFGNLLIFCAPGLVPAIPLRIHSDINLIATVALVATGGGLRARQTAWDDVFKRKRKDPRQRALTIAGAALIPVGFGTWLITSAVAWNKLGKCTDPECAVKARLMAFTTRDVSVAIAAAGAGMLMYGAIYRRARASFDRERMLTVGPEVTRNGAGLRLSGSF